MEDQASSAYRNPSGVYTPRPLSGDSSRAIPPAAKAAEPPQSPAPAQAPRHVGDEKRHGQSNGPGLELEYVAGAFGWLTKEAQEESKESKVVNMGGQRSCSCAAIPTCTFCAQVCHVALDAFSAKGHSM